MSNQALSLPMPDEGEAGLYSLVGNARAKPGLADALEERLISMVAPPAAKPAALPITFIAIAPTVRFSSFTKRGRAWTTSNSIFRNRTSRHSWKIGINTLMETST